MRDLVRRLGWRGAVYVTALNVVTWWVVCRTMLRFRRVPRPVRIWRAVWARTYEALAEARYGVL